MLFAGRRKPHWHALENFKCESSRMKNNGNVMQMNRAYSSSSSASSASQQAKQASKQGSHLNDTAIKVETTREG